MKKILLTFICAALFAVSADAQHCAAATTSITPVPQAAPGLFPTSETLPCAVQGNFVSDTIFFKNFTSFGTFNVNSLKIDSIGNLPAGLCWVSNKANNTFSGGEDGIIYVSGTCTGAPGQYKLKIIVDVNVGITLTNQDAESLAGLRYYVRVKCPAAACTALDTVNGKTQAFIPYAACPTSTVTASITPTGPISICPNASTTLTANSGTGYTYHWSNGATTSSITLNTAGSYIVTVHDGADSAVSNTVVVTAASAPSAAISAHPDTVCGGSITLSAATAGLTYSWTGGATTQSFNATSSGTYTLTVTGSNTCTAVSAPQTVVINSLPTNSITRSGFTLSSSNTSGTLYQWYEGSTPINGANSANYTATANGNYKVVITNAAGCTSTSNVIAITNVGIADIQANATVKLYPNPNIGTFTIETNGRQGDKIEVYSITGKLVFKGIVSSDKTNLDLRTEAAGFYTVTVKGTAAENTVRFVIEK
jgi:hypothetical protein